MENFITGYPGHEHEMRAAMLEVLGEEKYNFFFDKVEFVEEPQIWLELTPHSSSSISSRLRTPNF